MQAVLRMLIPVLVFSMITGACAKEATPAPAPATPTPTPIAATPAPAPATPTPTPIAATPRGTPTPVATPVPTRTPAGELKIAVGSLGAETQDPAMSPGGAKFYLRMLYDQVVGSTAGGSLSKEMGMARDWEVSHGPDSSRYTLKLRPGVKFHNGDEVTSADVKFSVEYYMLPRTVAPGGPQLKSNIRSIETPDPLTVVITTMKPYAFMLYDLSALTYNVGSVLPSKYIQEKGADYFNTHPIGSGPYRFKEQRVGSHFVYEALPNHWRIGVPKYQTVRWLQVPEQSTRIGMLKTGEVDIIDVSRDRVGELDKFNSFTKEGSEQVGVLLNNTWEGYLSSPKVREALNLAIDRESIRRVIYSGLAELAGGMYYGSWGIGYKPLPIYPYDPNRAKQLLAEAYPGGIEITLYSYDRAGNPELGRVGLSVADMWGKIGVKVKIVQTDYTTYRAKWRKKELINSVGIHASSNAALPHGNFQSSWYSKSDQNLTMDPELDRRIAAVVAALDMDQYAELVPQVGEYLRQNHYMGPLVEAGVIYAAAPEKVARWNLGKVFHDTNMEDLFWVR